MSKKGPYIVTGGNAGIGKAIAVGLAVAGEHVVIVSRDRARGEQAQAEIIAQSHQRVELVQGVLSSIAETQQLADELLARYPVVAGLINNAGIWPTHRQQNPDGFELGFMVNHLAPFILSRRLLAALQKGAPARIVNLNAGLYFKGHFAPEHTPYGTNFHALRTYADTKLWGVLSTMELARRLDGSGVTVNAIHPGVIRTGLGARGGFVGWLLRGIKRLWGTPAQGADGPVWLAISPEAAAHHGLYFDKRKPIPLADNALVPGRAEACWAISDELAPGLPELPALQMR